ncbi:LOW QUALITY PROTEIN: tetratricopeptide repeat protein 4-like [Haliotis rubra]|uniref:LOW QUALITY PROTEIN: tetratricopeptide repeat protein 4-like n=1 Tax=Haliotis rubra TaxID=36100 RepID=UPI001EE62147|nr:LOW QUALITY PROTEIN: tetratricopeptide repeat protein 4-like [Haliotis rubra]
MNRSLIKQKKDWTDEERKELAAKLDAEFEQYLEGMIEKSKNKSQAEHEASIEEILADIDGHPAFMTSQDDLDLTKPLHPAVEGLMAIKYESDNPTARADSYRDDGNDNFKKKNYRIAIENYAEAIRSKSPDKKLNAVCYTNRAAAQYHLGNYGSSLRDCIFARKFQPDHWKAIMRGIDCCMKLNKHEDTMTWIDAALLLEPGQEELLSMRAKTDKQQRVKERDERKQAAQDRKEEAADRKLIALIQDRGIRVGGLRRTAETAKLNPLLFTSLESHNPSGAKVHVDESGTLFWPVLFFYPEHGQTDFIEAFNENDVFYDHLCHMFGPGVEPPPWDEDRKYTPDAMEMFFEDRVKEELHKVDPSSSLLQTMRHEKFTVNAGTPCFILLVAGSKCWTDYLKRYNYKT